MKPFDDRFADHVREVFDRHDEPFDPTAWASMKGKLLGRRKARFATLLSYASKVAAVLVLLGGLAWLSVWMFFPETTDLADSMHYDDAGVGETFDDKAVQALSGQTTEGSVPQVLLPDAVAADLAIVDDASGDPDTVLSIVGGIHAATASDLAHTETTSTTLETEPTATTASSDDEATDSRKADIAASDLARVVTLVGQDTARMAMVDSAAVTSVAEPGLPDSIALVGMTAKPSYVKNDDGSLQGIEVITDKSIYGVGAPDEGRFNWSVTAGSMLTYAEQQLASGLGFSGGVVSEYRASSVFSLSSGVVLAYQQFEVDGMPLRQRLARAEYSYMPDQYSARTQGSQSYEFLALDIPLNVHYYFQEALKSQWFFSAGFSSLLYLQERVSGMEIAYIEADYYDVALGSNRTMNYTSEVYVESNYEAFTRFDFARLLNLSIGYEIENKKSVTIIEPFIKYPLGTISSRNIKMGMGGVRMRLRFGH